jgi:hypothetical protein
LDDAATGSYTCKATNPSGTAVTLPVVVTLSPEPPVIEWQVCLERSLSPGCSGERTRFSRFLEFT